MILASMSSSMTLAPGFPMKQVLCAGAVELLQKGRLPADHWDWKWGADFRFVKDGDAGEETGDHTAPSGNRQAPLTML